MRKGRPFAAAACGLIPIGERSKCRLDLARPDALLCFLFSGKSGYARGFRLTLSSRIRTQYQSRTQHSFYRKSTAAIISGASGRGCRFPAISRSSTEPGTGECWSNGSKAWYARIAVAATAVKILAKGITVEPPALDPKVIRAAKEILSQQEIAVLGLPAPERSER